MQKRNKREKKKKKSRLLKIIGQVEEGDIVNDERNVKIGMHYGQ